MENIKFGGSFFCPRCQCTHSSATPCSEVQAMQQRDAEFLANLRETTEEEKDMQTQPLFTLTAEETEIVKELCYGKFTLSTFPSDYEKKIRHLYDRLKQYQDEHNK